jgi:cytochrome c2
MKTKGFFKSIFASAVVMSFLAACGGSSAPAPAATAAPASEPTKVSAEVVAAGVAAMSKNGCYACHAIDGNAEAIGAIGPNLSRIYAEASTIITQADYKSSQGKATTVEAYIRESILNPAAYLTPKCPAGPCVAGLMPNTYKDSIPQAELDAIVGYLMSLGR